MLSDTRGKPFKAIVCVITMVAFLLNTVSSEPVRAESTPSTDHARTSLRGGQRPTKQSPDSERDYFGLRLRNGESINPKELHVDTFSLPEYLGHVKDSWRAPNTQHRYVGARSPRPNVKGAETAPLQIDSPYFPTHFPIVIHIQDAHCNYSCQRKISDIIAYLNQEYGVDTINLEGGAKDYDLTIFTDIKDKSIRNKVSDYFVKEGLVNGAEYFAINNPDKKTILWGIEDTKLYIDNLNVYRESLKHKEEVDKDLNALTHILNDLKAKIYSKELLELDTKYSQYKAGNLEFKDYLEYLIQVKNTVIAIPPDSNSMREKQSLSRAEIASSLTSFAPRNDELQKDPVIPAPSPLSFLPRLAVIPAQAGIHPPRGKPQQEPRDGVNSEGIHQFPNIHLLSQALGMEKEIDFKRANGQRDNLIDVLHKKLSRTSLKELLVKTAEFKSEKISQKDFYEYLVSMAQLINIGPKEFPELQKYITYIAIYNAIDKIAVMGEMDKLESRLKEILCRNDSQRQLNKLSKNLAILKNIFNISLTKEDYKYYLDNEESFNMSNYTSFIRVQEAGFRGQGVVGAGLPRPIVKGAETAPLRREIAGAGYSTLDKDITDIDRYRENMSKFYEYSFKRDKAFIKNLNVGARSPRPNVSILITGGFHTENLAALFKKQGVSYISIMPNFKNDPSYECPYFKILSGEKNLQIRESLPLVLNAMLAIPDQLNPAVVEAVGNVMTTTGTSITVNNDGSISHKDDETPQTVNPKLEIKTTSALFSWLWEKTDTRLGRWVIRPIFIIPLGFFTALPHQIGHLFGLIFTGRLGMAGNFIREMARDPSKWLRGSDEDVGFVSTMFGLVTTTIIAVAATWVGINLDVNGFYNAGVFYALIGIGSANTLFFIAEFIAAPASSNSDWRILWDDAISPNIFVRSIRRAVLASSMALSLAATTGLPPLFWYGRYLINSNNPQAQSLTQALSNVQIRLDPRSEELLFKSRMFSGLSPQDIAELNDKLRSWLFRFPVDRRHVVIQALDRLQQMQHAKKKPDLEKEPGKVMTDDLREYPDSNFDLFTLIEYFDMGYLYDYQPRPFYLPLRLPGKTLGSLSEAQRLWVAFSGKKYDATEILIDGFQNQGPFSLYCTPELGWAQHTKVAYFLLQLANADIPFETKLEYIRAIREGRHFDIFPKDAFEKMNEVIGKIDDSFWADGAHKRRSMVIISEHYGLARGMPICDKLIEHYGGWNAVLAKMTPALHAEIVRIRDELDNLLFDFQNIEGQYVVPRFMRNWKFEQIQEFNRNFRLLTREKDHTENTLKWGRFFIIYDQADLPISPDLPLKFIDSLQKVKVLSDGLDNWAYLRDGAATVANIEVYKSLESVWQLFMSVDEEKVINAKIRSISFSNHRDWGTLSYAIRRSAEVSPLFRQRIVDALQPIYDHIGYPQVSNFTEFVNSLEILHFLKQLYALDARLYPKYSAYGRAIVDSNVAWEDYLIHLSESDLEGFMTLINLLREIDPTRAERLVSMFIQDKYPEFKQMEKMRNLSLVEDVREKLNMISPVFGDEFIITIARNFIATHPVTSDNIKELLKIAKAWRYQAPNINRDVQELYKLVAYFIANDINSFMMTHNVPGMADILEELKGLGIIIVNVDSPNVLQAKVDKIAINSVRGNLVYMLYKAGSKVSQSGQGVVSNVKTQINDDLRLPEAFHVRDVLCGDHQVAYLFIGDPHKGAKVSAGFDVGFEVGGVSAKKFAKFHPKVKLALDFPLGFTTGNGKPTDIAIEKGEIKNWLMSMDRAHGLVIIYKDGTMKIVDKRRLRIKDLYLNVQNSKYPDRTLDLKKLDDYCLFINIAREQRLSITANMLLINDDEVLSLNDGQDSRRLLLEFSDGQMGVLNMNVPASTAEATNLASAIRLENGARVVKAIYCDTGYYDFATAHTINKGNVVLGHSDKPDSSNRLFFFFDAPPASASSLIGKLRDESGNVVTSFDVVRSEDNKSILIQHNGGTLETVQIDGSMGVEAGKSLLRKLEDLIGFNISNLPDHMRKIAVDLNSKIDNVDEIVVLRHHKDVRGAVVLKDNGKYTLYLNKAILKNPLALIHELGEGAVTLPEGYANLTRHTLMRGVGKDVRNAFDAVWIPASAGMTVVEEAETFIKILDKKMKELGFTLSGNRTRDGPITDSEKDLIRWNYANGVRGQDALFGVQDFLDVAENAALSSVLKDTIRKDVSAPGVAPKGPSSIEIDLFKKRIEQLMNAKQKIADGKLPDVINFGDKHGESEDLEKILLEAQAAAKNSKKLEIIGHGDYFDRGEHNIRNFEILRELMQIGNDHPNVKVNLCIGNHEVAIVWAMLLGGGKMACDHWLNERNGGDAFLRELQIKDPYSILKNKEMIKLAQWLLMNLKLYYVDERGFLHAHAGVPTDVDGNPLKTMEELAALQRELEDLRQPPPMWRTAERQKELARLFLSSAKARDLFELKECDWLDNLKGDKYIDIDRRSKGRLFKVIRQELGAQERSAEIDEIIEERWRQLLLKDPDKYRKPGSGISFEISDRDPQAKLDSFLAQLGVNGVIYGHIHKGQLTVTKNRIFCVAVEEDDPGHLVFDNNGIRFNPAARSVTNEDVIATKEDMLANIDAEIARLRNQLGEDASEQGSSESVGKTGPTQPLSSPSMLEGPAALPTLSVREIINQMLEMGNDSRRSIEKEMLEKQLISMGTDATLPLVDILRNGRNHVEKVMVCEALAKIGDERAIDVFVDILASDLDSRELGSVAAYGLGRIGSTASPQIKALLGAHGPRRNILTAILRLKDGSFIPLLKDMAINDEETRRRVAYTSLTLGDESGLETLTELFISAVKAYTSARGELKKKSKLAAVERLLNDFVRQDVRDNVEALLKADPILQRRIVSAAGTLTRLAKDKALMKKLVELIGIGASDISAKALWELYAHANADDRNYIALAMKGVGTPCVPYLIQARTRDNLTCEILGDIGDASAVPALVKDFRATGSGYKDRRRTIRKAVNKIGERALPYLLGRLECEKGDNGYICQLLVSVNSAEAIPAMVAVSKNGISDQNRLNMIEALADLEGSGRHLTAASNRDPLLREALFNLAVSSLKDNLAYGYYYIAIEIVLKATAVDNEDVRRLIGLYPQGGIAVKTAILGSLSSGISDEAISFLISELASPEPLVVNASLEAMRPLSETERFRNYLAKNSTKQDDLVGLLEPESRTNPDAINILGAIGTESSISVLIDRLDKELRQKDGVETTVLEVLMSAGERARALLITHHRDLIAEIDRVVMKTLKGPYSYINQSEEAKDVLADVYKKWLIFTGIGEARRGSANRRELIEMYLSQRENIANLIIKIRAYLINNPDTAYEEIMKLIDDVKGLGLRSRARFRMGAVSYVRDRERVRKISAKAVEAGVRDGELLNIADLRADTEKVNFVTGIIGFVPEKARIFFSADTIHIVLDPESYRHVRYRQNTSAVGAADGYDKLSPQEKEMHLDSAGIFSSYQAGEVDGVRLDGIVTFESAESFSPRDDYVRLHEAQHRFFHGYADDELKETLLLYRADATRLAREINGQAGDEMERSIGKLIEAAAMSVLYDYQNEMLSKIASGKWVENKVISAWFDYYKECYMDKVDTILDNLGDNVLRRRLVERVFAMAEEILKKHKPTIDKIILLKARLIAGEEDIDDATALEKANEWVGTFLQTIPVTRFDRLHWLVSKLTADVRSQATITALTGEDDRASRDPITVAGVPWWEVEESGQEADAYLAALESEISSLLGKKEYGPADGRKIKFFVIEENLAATKNNIQKALDSKAVLNRKFNQEVVIFAPQSEGALDEAYLKSFGDRYIVIPDAYSDIDTSRAKGFSDVIARIAITRLIAWCKEAESNSNAVAQKAALGALTVYLEAVTGKRIVADNLTNLLDQMGLLKIGPVNYRNITDWRDNFEAVATAL